MWLVSWFWSLLGGNTQPKQTIQDKLNEQLENLRVAELAIEQADSDVRRVHNEIKIIEDDLASLNTRISQTGDLKLLHAREQKEALLEVKKQEFQKAAYLQDRRKNTVEELRKVVAEAKTKAATMQNNLVIAEATAKATDFAVDLQHGLKENSVADDFENLQNKIRTEEAKTDQNKSMLDQ